MKTIGASTIMEQCLPLLEGLEPDGLAVAKHVKPVASLPPYGPKGRGGAAQ